MLVLSRRVGERVVIGDGITVTVTRVAGQRVMLGIEAPEGVRILRGELARRGESVSAETPPEARTSAVSAARSGGATCAVARCAVPDATVETAAEAIDGARVVGGLPVHVGSVPSPIALALTP